MALSNAPECITFTKTLIGLIAKGKVWNLKCVF